MEIVLQKAQVTAVEVGQDFWSLPRLMLHGLNLGADMRIVLQKAQRIRLHREAKDYLLKVGTDDALKIAKSPKLLRRFCNECLASKHTEVGGPIMDALEKLIQSFIDNPEKWINVISLIIKMFA